MSTEVKLRLSVDSGAAVQGVSAAEAAIGRLPGALDRVSQAGRGASDASDRLAQSIVRIGQYSVGLIGLSQVGQYAGRALALADEYTRLSGRLALVTESSAQLGAVQRELFSVAQSTRNGLGATAELYSRLALSTESLGVSQDRLIGLTKTIGQTMALSGGDTAAMNAALMQLGQGLGAGALRGEELNSVIEQTPALARAIAEGMGRTVGELKSMGEAGQITAAAVVQALEAMSAKVESDFRRLPMTVSQAVTQLSNAALQAIGVFDQGNGLSRGLAEGISFLAQNMDSAAAAAGLLAGAVGGRLLAATVQGVAAMAASRAVRIADTQAALAQANAEVARTAAVAASTAASAQQAAVLGAATAQKAAATAATAAHTAALTAQATAQRAATAAASIGAGAIGMLGGPIGLVTTLLGVGAAAWLTWGDSAGKAEAKASSAVEQSTEEIIAGLDKQIAKLRERNRLAQVQPDIGNGGGAEVQRMGELLKKIEDYRAGRGQAAGLNDGARQAVLQASLRQYAALHERVKDLRAEEERRDAGARVPAQAKMLEQYATKAQKLEIELKKARDAFGGMIPPGLEAEIRAKFSDPVSKAAKSAGDSMRDIAQRAAMEQAREAASAYSSGLSGLAAMAQRAEDRMSGLTDAQIALRNVQADPAWLSYSRQQKEQILATAAQAMAAEERADAEQRAAAALAARVKDAADAHAQDVRNAESSAASVQQRVATLREEMAAATIAAGGQRTLAQAVEDVALKRLQDAHAWALQDGNTDKAAAIQREIEARRELAGLLDQRGAKDSVGAFLKSNIGGQVADGFDRASQSLSAFLTAFTALGKQQQDYERARKAAGTDTLKLAQIEAKNQAQQINAYGTLAGAAKGFFREGSSGYKAMHAAERAFRAAELALSIKAAAEKIGLIGAVTTAKVASDAAQASSDTARAGIEQGNSWATSAVKGAEAVVNAIRSMPFPLNLAAGAATAAAVLALGVRIGGGVSGSAAVPTPNVGAGTVLGDKEAKSESIARSIDALRDVDTLTMRYSAQMLSSLRTIESSIGGVAALLVRGGGLQASAAGVQEGTTVPGLVSALVPFGGIAKALFGTKTTVTGQGIQTADQSLSGILSDGFDASFYADVNKKKKLFGFATSNKTSTQLTDAGPELERQFSQIFNSFVDTVKAAAPAVGVALGDVESRLSDFTVSLGRIDLKGLTGEQIQEKLSAVFGAAGDRIAQAALPGLADFQRVGEGYLETITRVASSVESAGVALDRFGFTAVSLAEVVNKQGDVGVELLRQAILGREAVGGLADIVASFDGSVGDLADAYAGLLDVRTALRQIGQDGGAISADLLRGAGGLQAMQDALGAYSDIFLTDAERLANSTATLRERFGALGVTMPANIAEFRALAVGIDASTAAGQRLLGQVLGLADGFSVLAERERAVADERAGLQRQILEAQGDTAAIRALERAGLDESNRALFDRLQALQDAKAIEQAAAQQATTIAQQREQLERQLLQAMGDTAEIRRRELAAIDPANRALQEQIWILQDAKTAAEEAAKLRDAWRQVGATIGDEVRRILGIAGSGQTSLAAAQAEFAVKTAAARAGDQTAAKDLAAASKAMLDLAAERASSAQELAALRAATAASLMQTLATVDARSDLPASPARGEAAAAVQPPPVPPAAIWTPTQAASVPGPAARPAESPEPWPGANRLLARIDALTAELEGLRHEARATAAHTARTARMHEDWGYRGLLVRTDADTPLHTKEAAP